MENADHMRALLAVLIVTASAASAADVALELDPAQTHIAWTLGDVLHTVHGTFKLTRGNIRFDPETGKASGELVVDAATGESGSHARDGRMHKHVLESDKFPAITFRPDLVTGAVNLDGDSQVQLHGSFGIHGAEHEITVPAKLHCSNAHMNATIDFAVPFVKWGMKDPSTLFLKVKDTVEIQVQTAGPLNSYGR
jgi:polyisoprenoid-binding protein YceI